MADFEHLNDLPAEVKVLLVQAQTQLEQTRSEMKAKGLSVDLTGRLQLRDDCRTLEQYIKKIVKGKYKEKDVEALKLAMIRLNTVAEGILLR